VAAIGQLLPKPGKERTSKSLKKEKFPSRHAPSPVPCFYRCPTKSRRPRFFAPGLQRAQPPSQHPVAALGRDIAPGQNDSPKRLRGNMILRFTKRPVRLPAKLLQRSAKL
jgi:hypothetical protein